MHTNSADFFQATVIFDCQRTEMIAAKAVEAMYAQRTISVDAYWIEVP
jgi:hypothetical protein